MDDDQTTTALADATTAGADGVPEIDTAKLLDGDETSPRNVADFHSGTRGDAGGMEDSPGDDGGTLGTGNRTEQDR